MVPGAEVANSLVLMAIASLNTGSVTLIMTVVMAVMNWKVCVVSTSTFKTKAVVQLQLFLAKPFGGQKPNEGDDYYLFGPESNGLLTTQSRIS